MSKLEVHFFVLLYFLCFLSFNIFFSFFGLFVLLYFLYFCTFSFGWTVHMNFHAKSESVALKMTELWVLLYLCTFCTFCTFEFFWTIHTNFHAKSGVCSSKNGWVIAVGTKEDGLSPIYISIFKRLYSPNLFVRSSQVWTILLMRIKDG